MDFDQADYEAGFDAGRWLRPWPMDASDAYMEGWEDGRQRRAWCPKEARKALARWDALPWYRRAWYTLRGRWIMFWGK